ncbi:unnamed protein product [Musa acuminata subsp. burmannicoides]
MAEVSSQKIQSAVLDMITMICSDKRTSSALQTVLKKVSGIVVGIACSSMAGLKDASLRALSGLACIDSDLTWLLLADVYYSLNRRGMLSFHHVEIWRGFLSCFLPHHPKRNICL